MKEFHRQKPLRFEAASCENRRALENLTVHREQSGFIEPVSDCLREADDCPLWRPVGIYDEERLIGFAMYGFFPEPPSGELWLDRLLIDQQYQGMGYGRRAVLDLLDRLRGEYDSDGVYLSVYEENTLAIKLYEQVGFAFNGKLDAKGEKIMKYLWKETPKKD